MYVCLRIWTGKHLQNGVNFKSKADEHGSHSDQFPTLILQLLKNRILNRVYVFEK